MSYTTLLHFSIDSYPIRRRMNRVPRARDPALDTFRTQIQSALRTLDQFPGPTPLEIQHCAYRLLRPLGQLFGQTVEASIHKSAALAKRVWQYEEVLTQGFVQLAKSAHNPEYGMTFHHVVRPMIERAGCKDGYKDWWLSYSKHFLARAYVLATSTPKVRTKGLSASPRAKSPRCISSRTKLK